MTNETGLLRDLNLKPGDRVRCNLVEYTVNGIGSHVVNEKYGLCCIQNCAWSTFTVTHRAPRTIGTLKEIGAKVGDVVRSKFRQFTVDKFDLDRFSHDGYTIISRATPSPVRTVTRKEIVPGVYGKLEVGSTGPTSVPLHLPYLFYNKDDINQLITTLTEIRDAL